MNPTMKQFGKPVLMAALVLLVATSYCSLVSSTELTEQFELNKENSLPPKQTDNLGRPILSVQSDDLLVEVPHYEVSDVPFTQARLEFDRSLFSNMLSFFESASKKLLHDQQSIIRFGVCNLKAMITLFTSSRKKYQEFVKTAHDTSPKLSNKFASDQGKMLHVIADAKSDVKLSGKEAHEEYMKILAALTKVINESPVGLYLDWSKLTINGKDISQIAGPIVQRLRDDGRGPVLRVLHELANLIIKTGIDGTE